jgi:2-keto-3-deoxy-L-rhamnonate aldolase RhmA
MRRGDALVGTVITLPDVALAELVAEPLDFVWIDLEHGALGAADVAPLAIAAGAATFVRLPEPDASGVSGLLDAGVDGVVAPRVESAAQACRLVDRLRRLPRGSRGHASRRSNSYGRAARATADPLCLAQIETSAGVRAAAEIARVDGIDALVVGCSDLALSLDGVPEPGSPRMREAIGRVQSAAEEGGVQSGIAGPDDPCLLHELAGGRSTLLVCGADVRLFARAVDDAVARLRSMEAVRAPA